MNKAVPVHRYSAKLLPPNVWLSGFDELSTETELADAFQKVGLSVVYVRINSDKRQGRARLDCELHVRWAVSHPGIHVRGSRLSVDRWIPGWGILKGDQDPVSLVPRSLTPACPGPIRRVHEVQEETLLDFTPLLCAAVWVWQAAMFRCWQFGLWSVLATLSCQSRFDAFSDEEVTDSWEAEAALNSPSFFACGFELPRCDAGTILTQAKKLQRGNHLQLEAALAELHRDKDVLLVEVLSLKEALYGAQAAVKAVSAERDHLAQELLEGTEALKSANMACNDLRRQSEALADQLRAQQQAMELDDDRCCQLEEAAAELSKQRQDLFRALFEDEEALKSTADALDILWHTTKELKETMQGREKAENLILVDLRERLHQSEAEARLSSEEAVVLQRQLGETTARLNNIRQDLAELCLCPVNFAPMREPVLGTDLRTYEKDCLNLPTVACAISRRRDFRRTECFSSQGLLAVHMAAAFNYGDVCRAIMADVGGNALTARTSCETALVDPRGRRAVIPAGSTAADCARLFGHKPEWAVQTGSSTEPIAG